MVISPQYAGDGAYSTTQPSGGLDRDWKLLKQAMENATVSSNKADAERTKSLQELSGLLDDKASGISKTLDLKTIQIATAVSNLAETVLSFTDKYIEVANRCERLETAMLQVQAELDSLRNKIPADATAGLRSTDGSGRTPIERYLG